MKSFTLLDTFLIDGFYVTQNYLANPDYYSQFGLLGHEGVDFGHANKQVQVRSPLSGTAFVGSDAAYGDFVVVEDYIQQCGVYLAHFDTIHIVSGEEITMGDTIGEMGDTGNTTGEHVHFNFIILNEAGNKKYTQLEQNRGFLDPQYSRDPNPPITFPGVVEYQVHWNTTIEEDDMATMYQGYDLDNHESMKVAVDVLVRVKNGEFIDKELHEQQLQKEFDKGLSEGLKQNTDVEIQPIQDIAGKSWKINGLQVTKDNVTANYEATD